MSFNTNYVRRVLTRASKYTWISCEDVEKIAFHAACRFSRNPHTTVYNSFPQCCFVVEMLFGMPPLGLFPGDDGYRDVLKIVKKHKDKTKVMIELLKLQGELKNEYFKTIKSSSFGVFLWIAERAVCLVML